MPLDSGEVAIMKRRNRNKIKGSARELKGTIKEKTGRATRNPNMEDEGRMERAGGKLRKKAGQIEDVMAD